MSDTMRFASTSSTAPTLALAARDAIARLRADLGGDAPDLLIAFVSAHHESAYDQLPDLLEAAGAEVMLGCSAGGVIGGAHEIETQPGLALFGAVLPGVRVTAFHSESELLPAVDRPHEWEALVRTPAAEATHVLLLADPFTYAPEPLLDGLDRYFPTGCTVGGLASGGAEPGRNVLLQGTTLHRSGAVGVALSGAIAVDAVVAQGCRPIGDPMFVTAGHGQLLHALDGEPGARVMRELYDRLEAPDQELFRHALFLGVAMRESRETYRQGDFLIRNIVGLDTARGALVVGASLREGSVVQFHLRDAATSAADLEALLACRAASEQGAPLGGLLFSCLGRGAQLYGRPDHDSEAFRRHCGDVPLAGFFCNGEIGPVHGTTFVHGYTSVFALFAPRRH